MQEKWQVSVIENSIHNNNKNSDNTGYPQVDIYVYIYINVVKSLISEYHKAIE